MRYKPFLSHRRPKQKTIAYLKEQLRIRGPGGWKDTDELPIGGTFRDDLIAAINNDTGGFIYWATEDTLKSATICETELPTALNRARRDPSYPVVPVFVELTPADYDAIANALGPAYARQLLGANGVLRSSKETRQQLAQKTARSYVKQLVRSAPDGPVSIAITAFRAPTERHDMTLDWRSLFDQKRRILRPGAQETVIEALGDIREALQSRERCPEVTVEVNLPIALAMLVGHELRWTTQVKVTINTVKPGTSEMLVVEPAPTVRRDWPTSRVQDLPGAGPVVLAVSVGSEIGAAATRWAADNDARGIEALHIDRDPASDPLDADDIRALAAHIVKRLNELQADGSPKHLLLRGPAALGTAIGLAANASGPTYVPFYDGHDYYVGGLWIG